MQKFKRGTTNKARLLSLDWIKHNLPQFQDRITLGLPEYDDRFDCWRVPINSVDAEEQLLGLIKIDNSIKKIIEHTDKDLIVNRLAKTKKAKKKPKKSKKNLFYPTPVPNKIVLGDCIKALEDFPMDSVQLVFTSPPYYNAKPEYSEYVDYQEYLDFMRKVIVRCHNILSEGRFFVINVSPVLIKRTSRNTSSRRIPIPFDLHRIFDSVGFQFIDDIHWVKPEGAGWNLGRGRRFKADRQPLQYKPVPVTEYILVYRKKTDKLIDWNIRNHYDKSLVEQSKLNGEYDVTNIWKIHPGTSKDHPAVFPEELVRKVVKYYSFKNDLVLDPFAGIGTVGKVALELNRRFVLIEKEMKYYNIMQGKFSKLASEKVRIDFDVYEEINK